MITVKKSPTADTRTCDWSKVTKQELLDASRMHIGDVASGLELFVAMLNEAKELHDFDKLSAIDQFHADFVTGFKQTAWWDNHRRVNRHHLNSADGVRPDVDLVDVIEHIVDCVMAGMARSGNVYDLSLPDSLLRVAFHNTVEMLKKQVIVEDDERKGGA